MAHRRKPQTPGKLLRLLYIRTLRNSSAPVLSKAITTRRCARKEDRSKPEPDRSKPGRMCALAWSRASARGRRRCSSGAAPGVATENSCFPSRKTNLPPLVKSSTFSLCKNATVNGKQLCGKENKLIYSPYRRVVFR